MRQHLRTLVLAVGLVAAATACSPAQTAAWIRWHNEDPEAAVDYAVNHCGELCTNDTNHNGIVEPDAPAQVDGPASADQPAARSNNSVWDRLAYCESGGDWHINTGNGYSGGLQFLHSTWRAYGGSGIAADYSREAQIAAAEEVLADVGWGAWPACSRKLGLR